MSNTQALAEAVARSVIDRTTLPAFPDQLSMEAAYVTARLAAARVADDDHKTAFAGLKAGLTDAAIQQHFGLDEALIGHLYAGRQVSSGTSLPQHGKSLIECELAIRVDGEGRPLSVAPALEFVRLEFASRAEMTPANLVATNLGADTFLVGEPLPWGEQTLADLADASVRLLRDGEPLLETAIATSLGGPQKALAWMLAQARQRDWPLSGETVLLTGTVGQPIPFQPGAYRMECRTGHGMLEALSFRIV